MGGVKSGWDDETFLMCLLVGGRSHGLLLATASTSYGLLCWLFRHCSCQVHLLDRRRSSVVALVLRAVSYHRCLKVDITQRTSRISLFLRHQHITDVPIQSD